jgi:hypothetical protein
MKDAELQPLLGYPNPTADSKRALATGLIVNHFALLYDLWRLGGIPTELWKTLQIDLGVTASRPGFEERWRNLRRAHRPDFVHLVDNLVSQTAHQQVTSERPVLPRQHSAAVETKTDDYEPKSDQQERKGG